MANIGVYVVPVLIMVVILIGLFKKEKIFSLFCEGAKEGLKTVLSIAPPLIGLVTAVEMFKKSGALDILTYAVKPVADFIGFPSEILPLTLLRPVSGSGSISLLNSLLNMQGPDSFAGRVGCVMCGSTDTTFYAVTLYFGSCKIKNTRHTLSCSITADIASLIMSILTVTMLLS